MARKSSQKPDAKLPELTYPKSLYPKPVITFKVRSSLDHSNLKFGSVKATTAISTPSYRLRPSNTYKLLNWFYSTLLTVSLTAAFWSARFLTRIYTRLARRHSPMTSIPISDITHLKNLTAYSRRSSLSGKDTATRSKPRKYARARKTGS